MKYMQAEDAERNPSNCMSREIAVKVNNELQHTHSPPPPLLLLLLFLLLPELLETCSQLSRESVNFPLPGFNPQASPYSSLICNRFGAGLTLWAEQRQERGCCRGWRAPAGGGGTHRPGRGLPGSSRSLSRTGVREGRPGWRYEIVLLHTSLSFFFFLLTIHSPPPVLPSYRARYGMLTPHVTV